MEKIIRNELLIYTGGCLLNSILISMINIFKAVGIFRKVGKR